MKLLRPGLVVTAVFLFFFLNPRFGVVFSQDAHFSQFYAQPLYLNPALTGTESCTRFMAGYRNQWPSLEKSFVTYAAAADRYFEALSGGVGLTVIQDESAGMIQTLRISGMYAYHLKVGRQTSLNAGMEVAYHQQRINWDQLIFPDMINSATGQIVPSGEVPPENTSLSVVDFSFGLALGIIEKYYVGVAGHHLTEPSIDYYSVAENNKLYRKYTVHAGGVFTLIESYYENNKGELTFNPNVLYQGQKNAQQLNLGFNFSYHPVTLGSWYRYNFSNPDALIFLVGITQKRYRFGYSYDYSLSKLVGESGGAHEVSLAILINCEGKRNRRGAIKCPEF